MGTKLMSIICPYQGLVPILLYIGTKKKGLNVMVERVGTKKTHEQAILNSRNNILAIMEKVDGSMRCSKCGWELKVIESRSIDDVVIRYRVCKNCGNNIYTEECIVEHGKIKAKFAKARTLAHIGRGE